MKRALILFVALLIGGILAAQTGTLTFPDVVTPAGAAGSANTNLTAALIAWKAQVEGYLNNHESRLVSLDSRLTTLENTVAKLQQGTVVTPPPAATPITFYLGDPKVCASNPVIDPQNTATNGIYINIGWIKVGQIFTCNVTVPTAGGYQLAVTAATPYSGGIVSMDGTQAGVPNSGSWNALVKVNGPVVQMTAGQNAVTVVCVSGGMNLSQLILTGQ